MTSPVSIETLFAEASTHHEAGRLEQALEGYAEIVERDPSHVAALVHVAELYWRHAREADARMIWERVLALEEAEVLRGMEGLARPFMVLVAFRLESDGGELVDRLLARAVEVWPEEAQAHEFLAVRQYETGDGEAAEIHFDRAAELAPERVESWFNLGATRAARGDVRGALTALDRVLEIDPLYNQTIQQVIVLVEKLEDESKAEYFLNRLQEVADEDLDVLAYVGFRFMEAGNHEGALSAFAQAADADLESYRALFGAAAAAHRLGEAEAAVEYGRQGLALLPDDLDARLTIVRTFHQDLPAEATAEVFEAAITTASHDPDDLRRVEAAARELGWEAAAVRSRRQLEKLEST